MEDEDLTLAELMLHAEQFCCRLEGLRGRGISQRDEREMLTKLGQCRMRLSYLQTLFDEDKLPLLNHRCELAFGHS
jgi:hypothetical protein